MPRALSLLVLPLVLLAAACGGGSTSATGSGTASGAEVAPATAVAFISLDTDDGSDQWKQADELLQKFPGRAQLISSFERELADENVDYERDIRPALGQTLDVVVLGGSSRETLVVGLTQPDDEAKLDALLKKSDDPMFQTEIDGWTAFSDEQAALDALKADGDKLEDSEAFQAAMAALPEEANAKGFLSGGELVQALRREVPQFGSAASGSFEWVSFALSSADEGWKVDGAAKGGTNGDVTFDRSLLDRIPSGALVALAFNGSSTTALDQLRKNPDLSQQSAQLEQLLGIGLDDAVALFGGSSVFYARPGSPFPEATLVTKPKDPNRALQTIDRAATRIAVFAGGTAPRRTTIGSVEVREIALGRVSLYYGVRDDELIASTATAPFRESSGPPLADDPVFSEAADAVDLPDDAAAFVYVNIRDSFPVVEGFARAAGEPFPADATANIEPLTSFLGFSTIDGDLAKFSSLLQVS